MAIIQSAHKAIIPPSRQTAITRYKLEPGTITVHNDRGAPMTSAGFVDLLAQLGVERSLSRPRVSNDNPY